MVDLVTHVRNTVIAGVLAVSAVVAFAVLTSDRDDRTPNRQRHPDRDRDITLTVVTKPARKISVRWTIAGRGDTAQTQSSLWRRDGRARRGDVIVVDVKQIIQGPYIYCAIYVDEQLRQFKTRDDGGSCVIAYTVE